MTCPVPLSGKASKILTRSRHSGYSPRGSHQRESEIEKLTEFPI